ncbi:MAG: PDZ domain-containing protein, partial [Planctomycetes bacterium]|nr:PDZ domain-containing protein [Planctomycetota bacterium]
MRARHFPALPVTVVLLPLSLLAAAARLRCEEPRGAAALAEGILEQIEGREGERFWASVDRLEALGKEALPALRAALKSARERGRLACATVLLEAEDAEAHGEALDVLQGLAKGAAAKEVRSAALEVYGENGDPDEVLKVLEGLLDETIDPAVLIPLCRTLWDVDKVARARDKLVDLLASKDLEVKREAALALAEIGYAEGEVREVLRALTRSPTPAGRRAEALERIVKLERQLDRSLEKGETLPEGTDPAKLVKIKEQRIRELEDRLERAAKGGAAAERTPADQLFEEIILQVQKNYVDESKTDRKRLLLSAIRGMVRGLDEFSQYMDSDDTKSFRESISGEYPGIGAQVNKLPGGPLEIVKAVYGGPAYKAGILSGDRVLEVDDVRTEDQEIDAIVPKLRGPAGSKVTLRVHRRGWSEPRTFTI